jgi:hypothetical protein
MIATSILLGFFTAIGWWGGNKVTAAVDSASTPPAIQCEANK